MVHKEIYLLAMKVKRPVSTGPEMDAIYPSPLDYMRVNIPSARTQDLQADRSLIQLLSSLFLKKISLLRRFKFPVNSCTDWVGKLELALNFGLCADIPGRN